MIKMKFYQFCIIYYIIKIIFKVKISSDIIESFYLPIRAIMCQETAQCSIKSMGGCADHATVDKPTGAAAGSHGFCFVLI